MALPSSFTGYSTIQNNYDRLSGVQPMNALQGPTGYDPIQYSQPADSLRRDRDVININTQGNLTPQQRVENRANRLAENQAAQNLSQFQAYALTQQGMEPIRNSYFENLKLTPTQQQNFNRTRAQGYSDNFSYANINNPTRFSSPYTLEGRNRQDNVTSFYNQLSALNSATGLGGNSLEQSYQRLFGRV